MKSSILFTTLLSLLILTGCGKMDVVNQPAIGIAEAPKICIIESPQVRQGFIQAIQSWLTKEGIAYQVLPANSDIEECEWALRYYGLWSWDLALFLSNAEITAYHNGKQVGQEKLIVGQWDANKFEKGEIRIHKMMDMLYSKASHYAMPKKKQ